MKPNRAMMDHVPYLLGAAAGTKQVSIRAGDVHTAMKLKDRMPAVATALGAKTFETASQ